MCVIDWLKWLFENLLMVLMCEFTNLIIFLFVSGKLMALKPTSYKIQLPVALL